MTQLRHLQLSNNVGEEKHLGLLFNDHHVFRPGVEQ